MKYIALGKNALSAAKRAIAYIDRDRDKKGKSRRKREKRNFSRGVTIFLFMMFAGACLLGIVHFTLGLSLLPVIQKNSLSAEANKTLDQYSYVVRKANKVTTLSESSSASLTAYPNGNVSDLSSSLVDEKTGNQHYEHYVGKGGVTTRAAEPPLGCPLPLPDKLIGYIGQGFGGDLFGAQCSGIPNDFLTADNNQTNVRGALLEIPYYLTTGSPPIQSIVGVVQGISVVFIAPIIMLIGFSVMRPGRISYADALEAIPRLVLALLAMTFALDIADQLIQFGNAMIQILWFAIRNSGADTGQLAEIVMPSSVWEIWLRYLLGIGITMLALQGIAAIGVIFLNIGGWIVIGIVALLGASLIVDAPKILFLGLSMALGAQVIVRIIMLDFYIILSPLALIALGLPGQDGVKFAKDWIYGFLSLIVSQFAQVAVLGIAMVVHSEYLLHAPSKTDAVALFIEYSALGVALRVPSLFKTNAAALVQEVGPMVADATKHERTRFF